jgi:hypothetical protein
MTRQRQESALTTNFKASPAEPAQTHGSDPTFLNSADLDGDTGFLEDEFYRLLEESRFVAGVIEIHINNERRTFTENTPGTDSHHHAEHHRGREWQELVRTNLPYWLFWLTHILTVQAKLAAEDRAMSRRQLVQLLNDRLFRQAGNELGLKGRRKRIWTPDILRNAVHCGLKDINTPGAVTLENLARRITARSKNLLPIALNRPLSGKHLQKLLQQNDIDWLEIKRLYKDRIVTRFWKR